MSLFQLHYISQNPGGGAANLTVAASVYAFIGTPPQWRRYSRLCWKQGPCHLLEEVLSPHVVSAIYQRGPHYLGSLQATQLNGSYAFVSIICSFCSDTDTIYIIDLIIFILLLNLNICVLDLEYQDKRHYKVPLNKKQLKYNFSVYSLLKFSLRRHELNQFCAF